MATTDDTHLTRLDIRKTGAKEGEFNGLMTDAHLEAATGVDHVRIIYLETKIKNMKYFFKNSSIVSNPIMGS